MTLPPIYYMLPFMRDVADMAQKQAQRGADLEDLALALLAIGVVLAFKNDPSKAETLLKKELHAMIEVEKEAQ
jgi:hypothetical protein